MKRKTGIFLIIAVLLICSIGVGERVNSYAGTLGDLAYWSSSSTQIGRWHKSYIQVGISNDSAGFQLSSYLSTACSAWSSALGISVVTSSYNSADFIVYGGTYTDLHSNINFWGLDPYMNGLTTYSPVYEGTWTWYSSTGAPNTRYGYVMTDVNVAIVDNGRTGSQYTNTVLHELGHALGWIGHSLTSTDVLYQYANGVTSLTNRDKNHLRQVYYNVNE